MEDSPIYNIYVMSQPWHLDNHGFPDCGSRECVGFYHDEETAIRAVEENWCDIQDHYARAAEIIETLPGLYPTRYNHRYWYYIWNQETLCFEETKLPKFEGFDF